MAFFRSTGRFLSLNIFRLGLLIIIPLTAIVIAFRTPAFLEQALDQSGIYKAVIPSLLDQTAEDNKADQQAVALLQDAGVRDAVNSAFSPEVLQDSTETILDGTYQWLDGTTSTPRISLNLQSSADILKSKLTDYATRRLATLPTCSQAQFGQLTGQEALLDLTCIPPGLDIGQTARDFSDGALKNTGLAERATLSTDDLPKDADGKRIYETQLAMAPNAYRWIVNGPWIVAGILLLSGALLVFAHDRRRQGIRALSWVLCTSGIVWVFGAILFAIFYRMKASQVGGAPAELEEAIVQLIKIVGARLTIITAIFGAALSAAGIAGILFTREPRQHAAEIPQAPAKPQPEPAATTANVVQAAQDDTSTNTTEQKQEATQ